VGKYAAAKGLPWLLDAIERVHDGGLDFELHIAGDGSGDEAEALRSRMSAMAPLVTLHGQIPQRELAQLMRQCDVCVLPSFYEGLPLVLVEAFACGCRLVATALPGIVENLAPALGDGLELVDPPSMAGIDTPVAADLPHFTANLAVALERSLSSDPLGDPAITRPESLEAFKWGAVFQRVEKVWIELLGTEPELSTLNVES
jgi:glycosyltransferase involved in cell wall biosynthesis